MFNIAAKHTVNTSLSSATTTLSAQECTVRRRDVFKRGKTQLGGTAKALPVVCVHQMRTARRLRFLRLFLVQPLISYLRLDLLPPVVLAVLDF